METDGVDYEDGGESRQVPPTTARLWVLPCDERDWPVVCDGHHRD